MGSACEGRGVVGMTQDVRDINDAEKCTLMCMFSYMIVAFKNKLHT